MTETLIERLRAVTSIVYKDSNIKLCSEAADALERMTERYRVLDETYGHTVGDLNEAQAKIDDLVSAVNGWIAIKAEWEERALAAEARIEHCGELLGRSEQECERAQARIEALEARCEYYVEMMDFRQARIERLERENREIRRWIEDKELNG